jgi:hypothetical protein
MASLTVVAAGVLAEIVCKLKGLHKVASKRNGVADDNRAEQGMPLENMETSGMRNRLGSGQASASANDNPESPSTASGESGTLTPRSEDNSESQGKSFVEQVQHATC